MTGIDSLDDPLAPPQLAPSPAAPVLVADASAEAVRARLAIDVTPGAPEPPQVPHVGRGGVWYEPGNAPDAWQPWGRWDP